ncbi:MAG: 4Fe-4S dicluster domain-containing protein [Coriobacteriia bacterium]|nr:4Fe-4S dicluster domain-containing protein [Coriobacteriia bacterium]
MAETAILYDASKCTACKGCQIACKQWNQLPSPLTADEYEFTKSFQSPLNLDPDTWLIMGFKEVPLAVGIEWNFMRTACFHCTEAACEMACPMGAISHKDSGAVVIDQEKCIGCQYCVSACPFSVPCAKVMGGTDYAKSFKCWQCFDRTSNGKDPACVTTCPTAALEFGDRAEMVSKAKARVDVLKGQGFTKAEVYGVDEVGGMHTIIVAHRGLEAHGLIRDPKVPATTSLLDLAKPLSAVGLAAVVGGLGLSFVMGTGYKRGEHTYDEKTDTATIGEVE